MPVSRARYYLIRSLKTVALLWVVLSLIFVFFRLMPGDFTDFLLYQGANEETIRVTREKWGLDDPLYVQYWNYMMNIMTLDAGTSFQTREPVWQYIRFKLFNTAILALPGITLAYIVGGVLGSLIADKRGSRFERIVITAVTIIGSFPAFFTAILLMIVFGVWLGLFPTGGLISSETRSLYQNAPWWRIYLTKDFLLHYTLPLTAIMLRVLLGPTLIMRTSTVEVTGQDFAYYQKVSGLPYLKRLRHLGRHAVLPLITLYPISLVQAVSGLVLVEVVFNWPGIGWALIQAIGFRDFPVVQLVFFLVAAMVIVANFGIDIFYGVIDPRVSVED